MRAWARVTAALLLVAMVSLGSAASGVLTTSYAQWGEFTGTANDYSTSFQIPVTGFPGATVTSDSRAGNVGIQSGATNWVGENTPIGLKYGSSRNQAYVALRPRVDNATGGSTTTYVFDEPTPSTGWTFALSDIDADQAMVTATDADGATVPEAGLGFVEGFNFCDTRPRPSPCSASVGDVPTWDPATQTLTGNPQAMDTVGAIGWFEPTVSIKTLTVVFTRRAGLPLYSTSFAALAQTLGGTVTDVSTGAADCPVDGVTLRLVGPHGEDLGTTTPAADGSYSFGQVATQAGYTVSVEVPADCAASGPRARTVSTVGADGIADFSVRAVIPQPVTGEVTAGGSPLPDVTVTLHGPGGNKTTTTASDGSYLFDDNPVGDGYYVTIDVPDGYTGDDRLSPFDVDATPITGQDFTLAANPDVSGTVSGGGAGLGGVTVTLTPENGPATTTVTGADGSYSFARVPSGTYDISVAPPSGYGPVAPIDGVVVADADVADQDFVLTRPGALGGQVSDSSDAGAPVSGVELTVDGPGGSRTITTDAGGQFFLEGLVAGTYTITLSVPDGYDVVGPTTRTVTITDEGEIRGGQDFVVEAAPTEPTPTPTEPSPTEPTPPPTEPTSTEPTATQPTAPANPGATPPSSPGASAPGSGLPDTGGTGLLPLYAGLLLVVGGAGALLARRRAR